MTDNRPCKRWILALSLALCSAGCDDTTKFKIVTKEEKDQLVAEELHLPPAAKNIQKLDAEWHTFDLTIDGRTRKFIRRYYNRCDEEQSSNTTDSFTELTPQ